MKCHRNLSSQIDKQNLISKNDIIFYNNIMSVKDGVAFYYKSGVAYNSKFLLNKNFGFGSVLQSKTFLLVGSNIKIVKRTMFSRIAKRGGQAAAQNLPKETVSSSTILTKNQKLPQQDQGKGMATINVRNHDSNSPDPQANTNNPGCAPGGKPHPEVVRGICNQSGCKEQPCGEKVTKLEGVAHMT
jgi:hypothetical protein